MPNDVWKALATAFLFLLMVCLSNNIFVAAIVTLVFYFVFIKSCD